MKAFVFIDKDFIGDTLLLYIHPCFRI